jgi:serine/threonine protein kinase
MTRGLTVLHKVGDGGGGTVFIVWHHRGWCPMACKVFHSPRRARREVRALSALDHPNVVRFFGAGGRGAAQYVLTEFLEGPSLRHVLGARRLHRLGLSDAARLAIHIGSALTHVHQRGFLHLDVTPSNIILTTSGRPVLIDFSHARRITVRRVPYPVGTDAYMAPEQCEGGPLSPATDVFGLGVTIYEALTGCRPFPEGTKRNPFPQLSTPPTSLRMRVPSLPTAADEILMACLARSPEQRPASPAEILLPLHRLIRRGPPMWPSGFNPLLPVAGVTKPIRNHS